MPGQLLHTPRWLDALDEARRRRDSALPCPQWFDRKLRGHMEARGHLPSRRLPPQAVETAMADQMNRPATRPRTIYIHIPFCTRICSFCAFFRQPTGTSDLHAYAQAVLRQIDRMSDTVWARQGPAFSAVYFGGGTPTALRPADLARLVSAIRERYRLASDGEFTVECRFEGLDEACLKHLLDAGVNRLSFGVQSFDTAVRRGVGRIADGGKVVDTIALARRLGFEQISVDLIYNLPGQSIESWHNDLRTLAATPATAASVYALIPMRGSALVKQIEAGRKPPLGGCAREYELFAAAHDQLLTRPDWRRFSFHHFGDHRSERSLYNQVRMGTMDTLALGCGAGGQAGPLSYMNAMSVEQYVQAATQGGSVATMAFEQPRPLMDLCQAYQLTETEGLDRDRLLALLPGAAAMIDQLIALGLVADHAGRLTLTRDGCFWGYNLTAMLTQIIVEHLAGDDQPDSIAPAAHRPFPPDRPDGVIPCLAP